MAVGAHSTDHCLVPGVRLSSIASGIKGQNDLDLVLIEFIEGSHTAGVFTKSAFAAAPVLVGRRHLAQSSSRYFLINSGNANAATGEAGVADAEGCCLALAQATGACPEEIIPFSTGVIGEKLQVERITDALPEIISRLDEDGWLRAAKGIMTTDTRPKITSRQFEVNGSTVTMTGIAKGSGMIQPNMATLLAYVATDGFAGQEFLKAALVASIDQSFNRITVDGDTSTNDSSMLTATGASEVELDSPVVAPVFQDELNSLMLELAQGIIRDAEGATKFIEIRVIGGECSDDCLRIAYSIANSPLVKTAFFAGDANWGRIVMAIGKAGIDIDVDKVDVYVGAVQMMRAGGKEPSYTEAAGAAAMAEEEITITVDLNQGQISESVWTSDLSHDYVVINAEYRT